MTLKFRSFLSVLVPGVGLFIVRDFAPNRSLKKIFDGVILNEVKDLKSLEKIDSSLRSE
jgi:hypothetical protein